jgi:hypothetical protein
MDKIVKTLKNGYRILETDNREVDFCGVAGWISYWIIDRNGERIETFSSAQRAERWFEMNKDDIAVPHDKQLESLARKLTRKMGLKWETLSEEEKREWIEEVSD